MKTKWSLLLGTGAAVLAAMAVMSPSRAADHLDGPRAKADHAADINDVYAYMSPQTAGHLVLAMTVFPQATATSKFSDKVDYTFVIKPLTVTGTPPAVSITAGASADVKCNFVAATSKMTCTGPNAPTATADFGVVAGAATDNIRVFAGLKSDPFYFDLLKFNDSFTMKSPQFTNPGVNFFQGLNSLVIVVELDAVAAFGAAKPILAVAGQTNRTGN